MGKYDKRRERLEAAKKALEEKIAKDNSIVDDLAEFTKDFGLPFKLFKEKD